MVGKTSVFILLIAFSTTCFCQDAPTYNWNWKKDGVILGSAIVGYQGTNYLMNRVGVPTESDLKLLNFSSVPSFDRGAISNNSVGAASISDMFLYSSFALPLISLVDNKCSNQRGAVIGMMFETLLINANLTNTLKATTRRLRPYAYSLEQHEEITLGKTTRQSFISGHTSTVAASTFFTAKVFSDLNPDSKWKPVIWASAMIIPATTGYLRYKAGRHFPSDIVVGYGVGALVGFLVPHFHKNNRNGGVDLNVVPIGGGLGVSLDMNLNKEKKVQEYISF